MRYDATLKNYPQLKNFILQHFEVLAVCPEVEIGLSVPRPPVQLVSHTDNAQDNAQTSLSIRGRDDASLDITQAMNHYCQQRPPQLSRIHGYIFKSKSPSCGIHHVPVFNTQNEIIETTSGFFVSAILKHYPDLPITDETALSDTSQRETFLQQVQQYQQTHSCPTHS